MSTFVVRMLGRLLKGVGGGTPAPSGYPRTYDPPPDGPAVRRPKVFEPALIQFPRAFRVGEPEIHNAATLARWHVARRQVVDHLLRTVAASPWREHLVLRGSVLLKAWLGDVAREPGDIDWVVVPPTLSAKEPPGQNILDDLRASVREHRRSGEPLIDTDHTRVDSIWLYDRSPGLRASFRWRHDDLFGDVQMDLAFGDPLLLPPVETDVPTGGGGTVRLLAATKHQSLAWKLQWLDTDTHPQGKDLYDATLLAESIAGEAPLPMDVLTRSLASAAGGTPIPADFPARWQVDWPNFRLEYPDVPGTAAEWQARLTRALAPTFADNGKTDPAADERG